MLLGSTCLFDWSDTPVSMVTKLWRGKPPSKVTKPLKGSKLPRLIENHILVSMEYISIDKFVVCLHVPSDDYS